MLRATRNKLGLGPYYRIGPREGVMVSFLGLKRGSSAWDIHERLIRMTIGMRLAVRLLWSCPGPAG